MTRSALRLLIALVLVTGCDQPAESGPDQSVLPTTPTTPIIVETPSVQTPSVHMPAPNSVASAPVGASSVEAPATEVTAPPSPLRPTIVRYEFRHEIGAFEGQLGHAYLLRRSDGSEQLVLSHRERPECDLGPGLTEFQVAFLRLSPTLGAHSMRHDGRGSAAQVWVYRNGRNSMSPHTAAGTVTVRVVTDDRIDGEVELSLRPRLFGHAPATADVGTLRGRFSARRVTCE